MGVKSGAVLMYGCPRNPSRRSAGGVGGPWGLRDVGEGELPALVTEPVLHRLVHGTGEVHGHRPGDDRTVGPDPVDVVEYIESGAHEDVEGPEETGGHRLHRLTRRPLLQGPGGGRGRHGTRGGMPEGGLEDQLHRFLPLLREEKDLPHFVPRREKPADESPNVAVGGTLDGLPAAVDLQPPLTLGDGDPNRIGGLLVGLSLRPDGVDVDPAELHSADPGGQWEHHRRVLPVNADEDHLSGGEGVTNGRGGGGDGRKIFHV